MPGGSEPGVRHGNLQLRDGFERIALNNRSWVSSYPSPPLLLFLWWTCEWTIMYCDWETNIVRNSCSTVSRRAQDSVVPPHKQSFGQPLGCVVMDFNAFDQLAFRVLMKMNGSFGAYDCTLFYFPCNDKGWFCIHTPTPAVTGMLTREIPLAFSSVERQR